jgi:hypothetical protein
LGEDLPLELSQIATWLDAELVEGGMPFAIRRQRFCLAAAPVESEHQLSA